MTVAEKIDMYRNKKKFIEGISNVFRNDAYKTVIDKITFEVYQKELDTMTIFYEWIVVRFMGGTVSAKSVNGNSDNANFRAVGSMLDGGVYDEVFTYKELEKLGYELVAL